MPRRLRLAIALTGLVSLAALAASPEATARIDGPCTGTIGGQDVSERDTGPLSRSDRGGRRQPRVGDDAVGRSPSSGSRSRSSSPACSGPSTTVPRRERRWVSEVPVHDYAVYGIGLYKVIATSTGQGFTCTGEALVDVEGDEPLDPLVTDRRPRRAHAEPRRRFRRAGGRAEGRHGRAPCPSSAPRSSGSLFGAGVGVLLQQFSVVYPTLGVAGALLAGGAALGLLFTLFGLPERADARGPRANF